MTARTLIKTDTAGWYTDPNGDPDKKVRKSNGDRIVTADEYAKMLIDGDTEASTDEAPAEAATETPEQTVAKTIQKIKDQAKKAPAEKTTLTSGAVVTGKTVEIRCAWVDPDKRTDAQVKLFEGDPRKITYDAVKAAAGGKRSAFPDGSKRTIKVQDQFQVRFSTENQQKWRAELRRRKNKARREAARAKAGA